MKKFAVMSFLFLISSPVFAVVQNPTPRLGNINIKNTTNNRYDNRDYSTNSHSNSSAFSSSSSYQTTDVSSNNSSSSNSSTVNNITPGTAPNNTTMTNNFEAMPAVSAPAMAPNMAAPGNNSTSFGIQTIFGGVSGGRSTVDSTVRMYNRALVDQVYIQGVLDLQNCNTAECSVIRQYIIKRYTKLNRGSR